MRGLKKVLRKFVPYFPMKLKMHHFKGNAVDNLQSQ